MLTEPHTYGSETETRAMGTVSRKDVAQAVNFLILHPNCYKLLAEIRKYIDRFAEHPAGFRGDLEQLNSLIDVGVADRNTFQRLVGVIGERRKAIPESKRADYQRDMMRDRRARVAKALELHELTHHIQLKGDNRARQQKAITERWRKARDAYIAEKGDLSWAERNEAAGEFWAKVDAQLDASLGLERN